MSGEDRRSFQAAMALKYCEGNARQAERVFGWGRETVQLGLHEHRTGITCVGAQADFWSSIGMVPSWWMSTPCWAGRKV